MYNRYLGNTGNFYRTDGPGQSPHPEPAPPDHQKNEPSRVRSDKDKTGFLSGIVEKIGTFLPDGVDPGNILLVLILLLIYLEKRDEEILIILCVFVFMWLSDRKKKEGSS